MSLPYNYSRRIIIGVFVVLCLNFCWRYYGNQSMQKKEPQLLYKQIEVLVDYTPDNFRVENDSAVTGWQTELISILFPDMRIIWRPMENRKKAIEILQKGEADLYATSFPLSDADNYGVNLLHSIPLYTSSYVLVCKKEANWSDDFTKSREQPVHTSSFLPSSGALLEYLHALSYPSVIRQSLPLSEMDLVLRVKKGEIKYALVNDRLAKEVVRQYPSLKMVSELSFSVPQIWLLPEKNIVLRDTLNQRINRKQKTVEWIKVTTY